MANQIPVQAVINTAATFNNSSSAIQLVLFNADGTVASTVKRAAAQADTTAADLAALKVDFNALLAKLRTAGVIAP